MTIESAKEKIIQWVQKIEPDCHIPIYKLDGQYYRFGKKKRFYIIGTEFFKDSKAGFIITVGDWKTEEKTSFKSWDDNSEFIKKNTNFFI